MRRSIRTLLCLTITVTGILSGGCHNQDKVDFGHMSKDDQVRALKPSKHPGEVAARIQANLAAGKKITPTTIT